jgi:hypothetical protein
MLQADQLIELFKGKWIEAHGIIQQLIPDGTPGGATVVLKDGEKLINCRMGARWNSRLLAFSNGEELKIIGKMGPKRRRFQAAWPRIVPGTLADRYFPLGLLLQGSFGSRPPLFGRSPPLVDLYTMV